MLFLKVEPGGGAGVDLEDGLELLVAGGALGVPLGAELGPVQLSDESGELVAGVGGLGVGNASVRTFGSGIGKGSEADPSR